MQDTHVEKVFYEARESDTDKFKDSDPTEDDTDAFHFNLTKQDERIVATFLMKEHFATIEAARAVTDEYLRALEVKAALVEYGGCHVLDFYYIRADVVDRSIPPTDGIQALSGRAAGRSAASGIVTMTRPLPSPPGAFKWTPDVETLWNRFQQYVNEREPLPSMAYFCVTVVEMYANGKTAEAAKQFCISKRVLSHLRELCSNRGDETEARKPNSNKSFSPLTDEEKSWVVAVVMQLILRVGQHAYNPQQILRELTMNDFPMLTNPRSTH